MSQPGEQRLDTNRPGRALGLDLGSRRIGVAISDSDRRVATPLTIVKRVGDRPVEHGQIAELVGEHAAGIVVVGLPVTLDGEDGSAARSARSEVKALKKLLAQRGLSAEVKFVDERFSTTTAHQQLDVQGVAQSKRRSMVDSVAAAVILQTWIDQRC